MCVIMESNQTKELNVSTEDFRVSTLVDHISNSSPNQYDLVEERVFVHFNENISYNLQQAFQKMYALA